MLTVNVKPNSFDEIVFSAIEVRANHANVTIVRPDADDYVAEGALVFVMNEAGATVAKYDHRPTETEAPGPIVRGSVIGGNIVGVDSAGNRYKL
jgi:hypothetical protein